MKTAIDIWQFKLCLHYLAEGMRLLLLHFVLDIVLILINSGHYSRFCFGFYTQFTTPIVTLFLRLQVKNELNQ